jgi:hypothetical protein
MEGGVCERSRRSLTSAHAGILPILLCAMTTCSRFTVTYRITVRDGRSVKDHAYDICLEQTAETPVECRSQALRLKPRARNWSLATG